MSDTMFDVFDIDRPIRETFDICQFVWYMEHGGWDRCRKPAYGTTIVKSEERRLCKEHSAYSNHHMKWEAFINKKWKNDPYIRFSRERLDDELDGS